MIKQQDISNPGHTHNDNTAVGSGLEGIAGTIRGDVPRQDPSFMGKNQVDQFSSLIDPSSVDASGRTVLPGETLVQDVDEMGINSLY